MDEQPKKTGLELLREPFLENQIGKLPKPTKKREEMDKIPKASCSICKGYHATSNIIHLDFVGHAALTDRLLDADLAWNWEPLSFGPEGLPVLDKDGGLWIKLTVDGVTRLGYGDAQGKSGGDAMKERIGDALRNAGMRFGAALDLWHKGDLHANEIDVEDDLKKEKKDTAAKKPPPTGTLTAVQASLLKELGEYCKGDESEMDMLLKDLTKIEKNGTWVFLKLEQVRNPTYNTESWGKAFGQALGKLRGRVKGETGAAPNPLIERIDAALTTMHGDDEAAKTATIEGMTGKKEWRHLEDKNLETLAFLLQTRVEDMQKDNTQ